MRFRKCDIYTNIQEYQKLKKTKKYKHNLYTYLDNQINKGKAFL